MVMDVQKAAKDWRGNGKGKIEDREKQHPQAKPRDRVGSDEERGKKREE